jgi:hypothetical protein
MRTCRGQWGSFDFDRADVPNNLQSETTHIFSMSSATQFGKRIGNLLRHQGSAQAVLSSIQPVDLFAGITPVSAQKNRLYLRADAFLCRHCLWPPPHNFFPALCYHIHDCSSRRRAGTFAGPSRLERAPEGEFLWLW